MKDKKALIGVASFVFGMFVLTFFRELFAGFGHMINGVALFLFFNFREDRKITFLSGILILIGVSLLAYEAVRIYIK